MSFNTAPPKRIGRYDVLERLAVGGMAEVFLAVERGAHGVQRLVVVKRILPHLAQYDQMVRMFFQEAKLAAGISHPNVVQMLDVGEDGDQPYIAMEYVAGVTLKDLLADARKLGRPVPVGVAAHLIAQACAGAHAAHELRDPTGRPLGLVHRDLSPHNLIVDVTGHLKLLDFGIAKAVDDADQTRTGVLKGKIRYMSPEQCRQVDLDRRSDLFTLGIVAWELLAGERLFERQTELATMQAITTGNLRDLRSARPNVPGPVVDAIERALQVQVDLRWPNGDAMRRGLLDACASSGVSASQDEAAAFLDEVVGARLAARRRSIEGEMEGQPPPAPVIPVDPPTSSSRSVTMAEAGSVLGVAGLFVATMGAVVALAIGGLAAVWWFQPPAAPGIVVPTGPPVTLAIPPVNEPARMVADYEPLRAWLELQIDRPVRLLPANSYGEVGTWLAEGKVPYAVLPPYVYIVTARDAKGIQPLAMKLFDGSSGTDGVMLVREDSPARSAQDLVGRPVCFVDPGSTTGYVLARGWLRESGVDPDKGVVPRITGNHSASIRDLDQGACDAAATFSGAWMTSEVTGLSPARFRVLAVTGRTPHDAVCAGPAADPAVTRRLTEALLSLDPPNDLGMVRIGESERITGYVAVDDARWNDLRKAIQAESAAMAGGTPRR